MKGVLMHHILLNKYIFTLKHILFTYLYYSKDAWLGVSRNEEIIWLGLLSNNRPVPTSPFWWASALWNKPQRVKMIARNTSPLSIMITYVCPPKCNFPWDCLWKTSTERLLGKVVEYKVLFARLKVTFWANPAEWSLPDSIEAIRPNPLLSSSDSGYWAFWVELSSVPLSDHPGGTSLPNIPCELEGLSLPWLDSRCASAFTRRRESM